MLKILNRDYYQSPEEVELEFPNSCYVMKVENGLCKLLAVNTTIDSSEEYHNYLESLQRGVSYMHGGMYTEGDTFVMSYEGE